MSGKKACERSAPQCLRAPATRERACRAPREEPRRVAAESRSVGLQRHARTSTSAFRLSKRRADEEGERSLQRPDSLTMSLNSSSSSGYTYDSWPSGPATATPPPCRNVWYALAVYSRQASSMTSSPAARRARKSGAGTWREAAERKAVSRACRACERGASQRQNEQLV